MKSAHHSLLVVSVSEWSRSDEPYDIWRAESALQMRCLERCRMLCRNSDEDLSKRVSF